jgi:nucleoside-diphosphate-sugar epimerase
MKAQYLVTGGGGFIGSNIVRRLLSNGQCVRVLDDFSTGRRENLAGIENDVERVEGDIRDNPTLKKALKGIQYVLHLAAIPSVVRSVEDPLATNSVNVCGTLKILIEARDAGVERVVFSSSSSVYGDTPTLPKQEDMNPMPRSPYALSKLTGEYYCRMFRELYGLKAFSLRYFNVFGPRQNPKSQYAAVIPRFIDALKNNQSPLIHGDGNQTRDFTFVEDVAAANLCCCTAPEASAGSVCNIGCGDRITINELAIRIAAILGKSIKAAHDAPQKGDVRDSQADISRAKTLIGWTPKVNLDTGLRQTVEWFLKNG